MICTRTRKKKTETGDFGLATDSAVDGAGEWIAESLIIKPGNDSVVQTAQAELSKTIQKKKISNLKGENWEEIEITLPNYQELKGQGSNKIYGDLPELLSIIKEDARVISYSQLSQIYETYKHIFPQEFTYDHLVEKLIYIGIRVEECDFEFSLVESGNRKTNAILVEEIEFILSDDIDITHAWDQRINGQAEARHILSREGEINFAKLMDASLFANERCNK